MLVISKFVFVFLSSWYDCRRWANVGPTLASFRKSAALRQRFANRNKTFEQQLHLPFFNNISDFEIVNFFIIVIWILRLAQRCIVVGIITVWMSQLGQRWANVGQFKEI